MVRYLSLAWIDALGHEVAKSTELAALAESHDIGVTQVVTAGPEGDVTYHLRVGDGSASFGADPDGVVDYVISIIGRPTADSGWADPSSFPSCPGTVVRAVTWRDLTLYFGDQTDGGRRHFFGYSFGPPFGGSVDPNGVATDAGLTVGSAVAALRTAYPAAGIEEPVGDSPANFTIVEGLSGYLSGTADDDIVTQFLGGLPCVQ